MLVKPHSLDFEGTVSDTYVLCKGILITSNMGKKKIDFIIRKLSNQSRIY